MLHWLHSLLPHIPRYGFVLVFTVVFLSNIGVPLPGKAILFGVGVILGKAAGSLWQPVAAGATACFLGGFCCFWVGRRLGKGRLEKIRWLHLTPKKLKWPERFFKRHGDSAVFTARFIPMCPPFAANLFAGMAKIRWRMFLFYNLMGSAVSAIGNIPLGYFFGKQWRLLKAALGPTALYLIAAGITLLVLGVMFRHFVAGFWRDFFRKRGKARAR